MKRYVIIILIALYTFSVQTSWSGDTKVIKTIVVLPFVNLSGKALPLDFTRALYDYLVKEERFELIPQDVLEQFLIERRIRQISLMNRATVRELGGRLDVDALIMGSINLLAGGNNPKVDVSAQLVETLGASIIWANSISYSGNDFAKLLGIGKIKSLTKLVEIAIEDLLKNMPDVFERDEKSNRGAAPFEIVQANFYPQVTKGRSSVGLMIEIREINARPTYINAIVQDKDIPLFTNEDGWYTGVFVSPHTEGLYALKLYIAGQSNKVFFADALAKLIVDNTPPVIAIASYNMLISPNQDGINDYALFSPVLLKTDILQEWSFDIRDKHGKLVRSAEGGEELPRGLIWRGENNAFKPVEDGIYFVQLIIKDRAGHETATDKVMVTVDRTAPAVEIVLDKIDAQLATFNVKSKEASEISEWNITIYDQHDELMGTFNGQLKLPLILSCTVKKNVNLQKDTFTYSLEIRDSAGNLSVLQKQPIKIQAPEETETSATTPAKKRKGQWLEDF